MRPRQAVVGFEWRMPMVFAPRSQITREGQRYILLLVLRYSNLDCDQKFVIRILLLKICWSLVGTIAVASKKSFEKTCVGGFLAYRARKPKVGNLGECGGELRGVVAAAYAHGNRPSRAMTFRGWCFARRRTHLDSFRISSG